MTIKELYRWAKENDCENIPIAIPIPLTSEYEERILKFEDIEICKDQFENGWNKKFFGTDNVIKFG